MKNQRSKNSLILCLILLAFTSFFYYPRWEKPGTEATLSWDVNGYYYYLPSIFVYHDLKELKFTDSLILKYYPVPNMEQIALKAENGNYVLKYSSGQALQFLPFFLIGHTYALLSDYPADGYSRPYQIAISLGSLIIAFIGLYYLRKVLLNYFNDTVTAAALLIIAIGTNYLNYASVDGPMTHNNLFTIYSVLIYYTISYYKNPNIKNAVVIGACLGLAALTRPSEIISAMIPVLWGVKLDLKSIQDRITFLLSNFRHILFTGITTVAIAFIQLIYWKYASGHWLFYSYGEQSFSWLSPHLYDGIFSYKSGWLVYSPIMIFSVLGFVYLYKDSRDLFVVTFLFSTIFIYICFAWDIWWYGASLGQRAMVQCYPVLAFPLCIFIEKVQSLKWMNYAFISLSLVFIYFNIWLTHQAHRGGLLLAGQMTKAYFWKVLGKYEITEDDLKLLDTEDEYTGARGNVKVIYSNDFESDTSVKLGAIEPIYGSKSLCLDANNQFSPLYRCPINPSAESNWVRIKATFRCKNKEWETWRMTQFGVRFCENDKIVKENAIRVYRLLGDNQTKEIYFDSRLPNVNYDNLQILVWNAGSPIPIAVDNIEVESFKEVVTY